MATSIFSYGAKGECGSCYWYYVPINPGDCLHQLEYMKDCNGWRPAKLRHIEAMKKRTARRQQRGGA